MAESLCQCFDIPQVEYKECYYDGEMVSQSKIVTSKEYSMVSYAAFNIYAMNHDLNTIEECIQLDPVSYYGMNLLDYLIGNIDRHPENWGVLVDNSTNRPVSLYPLMDFNMSFHAYDNLNGANCQTTGRRKLSQREAAIEAVKAIGLRKKRQPDLQIFAGMEKEREIFLQRLQELEQHCF